MEVVDLAKKTVRVRTVGGVWGGLNAHVCAVALLAEERSVTTEDAVESTPMCTDHLRSLPWVVKMTHRFMEVTRWWV